jgi:hypothetical protein
MGQERNRKILKNSRSRLHQPRRAVAWDLLLGHWVVSGRSLNQKESHCPAGLRHLFRVQGVRIDIGGKEGSAPRNSHTVSVGG